MNKGFKWSLFLISSFLLVSLSSCKKDQPKMTEKPLLILTAKDSTEIKNLCTQYMDLLKEKKYDEAFDMLYCVDTLQNLQKIPETQKQTMRSMFNVFPVLNYHLYEMKFVSEFDTKVRYNIEFFEKAPDDNRPNTTAIYLRPIRKDDKWYLTVYDTVTDNSAKSN